MKKKEIWLQLHDESDKNYERFRKFLEFDGTLEEFVSVCCSDISFRTIADCSAKFKWLKRKKAYRNKHRQIIEKARDKVIEKTARDIFTQYEYCVKLLMDKAVKYLTNYDDLMKAMPPQKVINLINTLPAALKQMKEFQNITTSEAETKQPVIIDYIGGFDLNEYKDEEVPANEPNTE